MLRNEMPIFDVCRPCSVQYDFIAKFETLNYDMDYLSQKFNFPVKFPTKEPTTNPDYMRLYYHGLKNQHLKVLKTLYRKDFEVSPVPLKMVPVRSVLIKTVPVKSVPIKTVPVKSVSIKTVP